MEQDRLLLSLINVECQLDEINGTFHRLPPKDDSYCSTNWAPQLAVDLPAFLSDLLSRHVMTRAEQRCPVRPRTVAVATTCSWRPNADTIAAATTPGESSAQLSTGLSGLWCLCRS